MSAEWIALTIAFIAVFCLGCACAHMWVTHFAKEYAARLVEDELYTHQVNHWREKRARNERSNP